MDLTLDFLRMSIPLSRLVKGVPGYEIPEEIGFFACDALDHSVHPDRIDERLELFHQADRTRTASYKRTYTALQYAYYWLQRMVLEDCVATPKRRAFMGIQLHTREGVMFAIESTGALLQEHQNYIGEEYYEHSAPVLGLVEALADFKASLRSAEAVLAQLRPAAVFTDAVGIHFAQLAWRATACACEYFAPNGSCVKHEDHAPYHRQWRRIAVEMLDMCVTLRLPDFTDPAYFRRAVAPSREYYLATRGARLRSPISPFQNQTPEHCESQALPQQPGPARSYAPSKFRLR